MDPIYLHQKRGHYGPHPRWKKIFWQIISFQKVFTVYFIKISYVLTELWIFFYLEWCFLSKKCHFQLKQLCMCTGTAGGPDPQIPSWNEWPSVIKWYRLQYRISFPTIKNLTETPVEISIPLFLSGLSSFHKHFFFLTD